MAASGWWRVVPIGLSVALVGLAIASCSDEGRAPVAPDPDSGDVGATDAKDGGADAPKDVADAPDEFPLLKPVVIQDKQNHPLGIALDAKYVYWVNNRDGAVLRLARDAKPITKADTLASGIASPERLAVDATHVYFTSLSVDASKVVRVPIAGGPSDVFALDEHHPRDILLDATHVYWTNDRDLTIRRQEKAATGSAETVFMVASSDGQPWGLGQFSDKLYVSTYAVGGNIYEHSKTPTFVPDAGPDDAKRVLAIAQDTALVVAVDANNVYWTVKNTGLVLQIPRTTPGSPTVLADKQAVPLGIAIDGTYVYWCNSATDGQLRRIKIGGDPAGSTLLADKQIGCAYVATDGNFVYWTNEGPGTTFFQGSVMAMRLK